MEFYFIGRVLAGLWCQWRHGKEWQHLESRVFPVQGYWASAYYCSRCKGEVETYERMQPEAQKLFLHG